MNTTLPRFPLSLLVSHAENVYFIGYLSRENRRYFFFSLQREFHCFTEKAIWNETGSEVRVKGQTAVIMSAGQHSKERNFFSITWTRIKGGGGAAFLALKLIGFIFFLWVQRANWRVTKRGEFLTFLSTESQSEAMAQGDKNKTAAGSSGVWSLCTPRQSCLKQTV